MAVSNDSPPKGSRFRILETFQKNRAPLRRFIARFAIPRQDIDDIAQEAFLRAYEVEKKRKIDEPKAFLFRIAKNLVLDDLARKKVRSIADLLEGHDDPEVQLKTEPLESNVLAQEKLGIFCEAVATLPPQRRKVMLLKKVYGLSHQEIANKLGLSVSTTEKHLIKAIRQCNNVIFERYQDRVLETTRTTPNSANAHFRKNEG